MVSRRWIGIGVAACCLFQAGAVRADYRDSFKEGMEAFDRKNWPQLEASMRQAIADRPAAGGRVKLYGMRFVEYLPYYYLGLALYEQGDCPGAVKAWAEAKRQGVVQGASSELALLERSEQECRAAEPPPPPLSRPVSPPPGPSPAELLGQAKREPGRLLDRAEALRVRLEGEREDPAYAAVWQERDLASRLESLGRTSQQLRSELERAGSQPEVEKVRNRASQLVRDLEGLDGRVDAAKKALPPPASPPSGLPSLPIKKVSAPGSEEGESATPALPSAEETEGVPPVGVSEAPEESEEGPLDTPPSPQVVPTQIRTAAAAYLGGDYRRVLRTLSAPSTGSRQAAMTSHVLLAAARYALYLEGGRQDDGLLKAARESVRECRKLERGLSLPERFFSPGFLELFRQQ